MKIKEFVKQNGNLVGWIVFIIFTCVYFYSSKQNGKRFVNKILSDSVIATGIVSNIEPVYKRGYKIEYSFEYDGKSIYTKHYSPVYGRIQNFIIGKSFPVIAYKKDLSENIILIFPDDFEAFKLQFPDSLSWVKKYE